MEGSILRQISVVMKVNTFAEAYVAISRLDAFIQPCDDDD